MEKLPRDICALDAAWDEFWSTGRVKSYLIYRRLVDEDAGNRSRNNYEEHRLPRK